MGLSENSPRAPFIYYFMIILNPIADEQTFNILLNVERDTLPLDVVTFTLRDPVTDKTDIYTGRLDAKGFIQTATVTFTELREGGRYELTVFHGQNELGKEVVLATGQTLENYSLNQGQFVYFDTEDQNRNHVIF